MVRTVHRLTGSGGWCKTLRVAEKSRNCAKCGVFSAPSMFETNQTVCHLCLQKSYVEGDRQRRLERLRRESEAEHPHALSCPECRVRVPETVSFCPGCGHQVRILESRNSETRRSPRPSNGRTQSRPQPQHKEPAGQKTWWQKVDRYTDEDYIGTDDGLVRHLAMMVRNLVEIPYMLLRGALFISGLCAVALSMYLVIWVVTAGLSKIFGG